MRDDDRYSDAYFRPQAVNVAKLTKLVDCDIMILECQQAVEGINNQFASGSLRNDPEWKADALRARDLLEHKIRLIEMKRADIQASLDRAPKSAEDMFATRFVKAAQDILPPDVFTVLFEAARIKNAA